MTKICVTDESNFTVISILELLIFNTYKNINAYKSCLSRSKINIIFDKNTYFTMFEMKVDEVLQFLEFLSFYSTLALKIQ